MAAQENIGLYGYSRYSKLIFLAGDIALLNAALVLAVYLRFGDAYAFNNLKFEYVNLASNIIWVVLSSYMGEYKFIRVEPIDGILSRSLKTALLEVCLVSMLAYMLRLNYGSRLVVMYFCGIFVPGVIFFRIFFIQALKYIRKRGYNYRNVVIIGAGEAGREIQSVLESDLSYGYRVIGYFDDEARSDGIIKVLGKISAVREFVIDNKIHEIYVAGPGYDESSASGLINFCDRNMIRVKFIAKYWKYGPLKKVQVYSYGDIPVVELRKEPLEIPSSRLLKRIFDIVFSALVTLLILPWLVPILAALVKLSSPGPVFFGQRRSGENNRTFICWKFRTMTVNAQADELQATKNDVRITPIGKFMRITNLDEFPQFFNVLIGDMSVVGPRPHMLRHTLEFSDLFNDYMVRQYIRPGITGWAQVNGYRGETTEREKLEKRLRHDLWYVENWSFFLDIKIIICTVINMVKGEKNAV